MATIPTSRHETPSREGVAAIILAAGRSSRMGACKPLLHIESVPVVARVAAAVRTAGITDVVVVTGHRAEEVHRVLRSLPVRAVHNSGYDAGMFSSVQAGARALSQDVRAFLILPVDYPLISSRVVERLVESLREHGDGILHPACCGLRGHPPLLAGRYRAPILQADARTTLRDLLAAHAGDAHHVEVEDPTILMDMDTADDYQRILRFASRLEASGSRDATDTQGGGLASDDAIHLLHLLRAPDRLIRHSRTVARVGEALGMALAPHEPDLDMGLVLTACLVHDLAKSMPRHAAVGERLLGNLGLTRLGAVVGAHMVLPAAQLQLSRVTEEQIVYLADKLVLDDVVCDLHQRTTHSLRGHDRDAAATEGARARMLAARLISDRVEAILGRPLMDVLSQAASPRTSS